MRNKSSKILLSLLLVAVLAFTLAACGSSGGGAGGKSGSLEGSYRAGVDMTETMSESSGLDIQTKLVMYFNLTLSSGNKYTIELDTDQFVADTKEYYKNEMPNLMRQALVDQGIPEDQVELFIQQEGYSSFEEFATSYLDEVVAALETQFAESDPVVSKGDYKVDGDSISLTDEGSGTAAASNGKIESNGSLSFTLKLDGNQYDVVFEKQ